MASREALMLEGLFQPMHFFILVVLIGWSVSRVSSALASWFKARIEPLLHSSLAPLNYYF